MKHLHLITIVLVLAFSADTFICPISATADTAAEINSNVKNSLNQLYSESVSARTMGEKAKGILVFPSIVKGGFIVGGQYGEGALVKAGKTVGYYNTVQASYGLQAGLQKYGYILFLMTDSAVKYIDKSDGWEVGVGPTITIMDEGVAGSATSTTLKSDIYAFFLNQTGLMAGLGLQGTKITKIEK